MTAAASTSQAWAILLRHAREEIAPLRLQELCSDNDRVSSLVTVHTSNYSNVNRILLADISRQRMTLETLNHLLRLASARDVRGFVKQLSWGQNDPESPIVPQRLILMKREDKGKRHVRIMNSPRLTPRYNNSNDSKTSISPSMHLALRVPENNGFEMLTTDGTNALDAIHQEWKKIEMFSENIRKGHFRGASGMIIRDVVVVGKGVAVMALKFMYEALRRDDEAKRAALDGNSSTTNSSSGLLSGSGVKPSSMKYNYNSNISPRRMRFITSMDPIALESAVEGLHPGSTIIVSISMQGNENEHLDLSTHGIRTWLIQDLGKYAKRADIIMKQHMILITANEDLFKKSNTLANVFLIPEHTRCEPFTTFTAAGLVPLSLIFGWKITRAIIAGAHDMDVHFTDTNPRHNLPMLLALTDIWNNVFLGTSGRILTPFSDVLSSFTPFVAALESQTCTINPNLSSGINGNLNSFSSSKKKVRQDLCSGVVIQGSLNGEYDRVLYQGERVFTSELITVMDTQAKLLGDKESGGSHDSLICSFFAHADVLAFGNGKKGSTSEDWGTTNNVFNPSVMNNNNNIMSGMNSKSFPSDTDIDAAEGNRPSTLLMCGKIDAFTCGQLIALSEHRAVVAAKIWEVNPFARNVGSSMRSIETEELREKLVEMYEKIATGDDEDMENEKGNLGNINLATRTILTHYAKRMHSQKNPR